MDLAHDRRDDAQDRAVPRLVPRLWPARRPPAGADADAALVAARGGPGLRPAHRRGRPARDRRARREPGVDTRRGRRAGAGRPRFRRRARPGPGPSGAGARAPRGSARAVSGDAPADRAATRPPTPFSEASKDPRSADRRMTVSREEVIRALRDVLDPELGMSVVDLGLIYDVRIDGGQVHITMT